jgi:predicted nucleic acid-binding protein
MSEDLQDGRRIGALTILDPFKHQPAKVFGTIGT